MSTVLAGSRGDGEDGGDLVMRVVRGDNGEALADALAAVLAVPPEDPLAIEEIVVHSRGMERWLSQHLSRRLGAVGEGGDGVCANMAFPFPIDIVRRAIRAAGGVDPRDSVWDPDRLVWPLMELVDSGLDAWAAPLVDRLADDPDDRFEALRGVSDLLDRYAAHRPDLVLRWLEGHDVGADGELLAPADAWQPGLLRSLREAVGRPSLAEEIVAATAALADGTGRLPGLPPRLGLFGFTALPAAHLAVLAAVAKRVDVTLYLLHPSPALWAARQGMGGTRTPEGLPVLPGRRGLAVAPPRNRLMRSWGRDAAEVQLVVN
ncbi:MAG TPA: exodeoxyribonuclease V subunit gamma, partial [Euzebya sp.]|nr:exodeoxyribonuclease V subunit gamma [Euzebya sp.]